MSVPPIQGFQFYVKPTEDGRQEYVSSSEVPRTHSLAPSRPPEVVRKQSIHVFQKVPMQIDNYTKKTQVPRDYYVGRLWRARSWFWEYAGEFFGTMILVMFGTAANCQYNLSSDTRIAPLPAGTWASLVLGWGTGIYLGVLLSGGHINPAVTLAMAVWRKFSWRKVPLYIIFQILGGICGAGIVYGNYLDAIDIFEGGRNVRTLKTAGFFGTVPLPYLSNMTCFWDEFIGTALLLIGLLSLLDARNCLSPGLVAIGFFFVFVGIASSFGMQTGFAVNPARDLGPRIFTSMVGYGVQVYDLRKQYWLWSPVFATIMGAQFGTMVYDMFLENGDKTFIKRLSNMFYHKKLGTNGHDDAPQQMSESDETVPGNGNV